jgi:hypothetical protein
MSKAYVDFYSWIDILAMLTLPLLNSVLLTGLSSSVYLLIPPIFFSHLILVSLHHCQYFSII